MPRASRSGTPDTLSLRSRAVDEKKRKEEEKAREERRKLDRFAWLGPMLERRKHVPEPLDEEADGEDQEEIEK